MPDGDPDPFELPGPTGGADGLAAGGVGFGFAGGAGFGFGAAFGFRAFGFFGLTFGAAAFGAVFVVAGAPAGADVPAPGPADGAVPGPADGAPEPRGLAGALAFPEAGPWAALCVPSEP